MNKVFVYGTLLTGEGNWSRLLAPMSGIPDKIDGSFKMLHLGGFPGVVPSEESFPPIVGEIFDCDDNVLARLDRLEGHPSFYKRELFTTVGGVPAWIYIYQGDHGADIKSSDWLMERNKK